MDAAMHLVASHILDVIGLWEQGLLSDEDFGPTWAQSAQVYWGLLRPHIEHQRERDSSPALYENLETFAAFVNSSRDKTWREVRMPPIDDSNRNEWLDEAIRRNTEKLELLEEIESRSIPRPPAETAALTPDGSAG